VPPAFRADLGILVEFRKEQLKLPAVAAIGELVDKLDYRGVAKAVGDLVAIVPHGNKQWSSSKDKISPEHYRSGSPPSPPALPTTPRREPPSSPRAPLSATPPSSPRALAFSWSPLQSRLQTVRTRLQTARAAQAAQERTSNDPAAPAVNGSRAASTTLVKPKRRKLRSTTSRV